MKKKVFMNVLLFCLVVFTFAGCTDEKPAAGSDSAEAEPINEESAEKVEYIPEKMYEDVLNTYFDILLSGESAIPEGEGYTGIEEYIMYVPEDEDALSQVGYAFRDISGDDIPELIIAAVNQEEEYKADSIYAVYSWVNEEPHQIVEGWVRNSYYLLDTESPLFNEGSAGAMYSSFSVFDVERDGSNLRQKVNYFTYCDFQAESSDDIRYYLSNSGGITPDEADKEITEDEYREAYQKYSNLKLEYDLTPFSDYTYTGEGFLADVNEFDIAWITAYDGISENMKCYEYTADNAMEDCRVVVWPDDVLHDFCVVSLENPDVDSDGNLSFDMTTVYKKEELSFNNPIILNLPGIENIPQYGFTYTDENGEEMCYAIVTSGMDGSVFAQRINEF